MSSTDEKIFALIDKIYSAAADPSQWPSVADSIQSAIGGHSVNLVLHDLVDLRLNYAYTPSIPETDTLHYNQEISQRDELLALYKNFEVGTAYLTQDILDASQRESLFAMQEFYNKFQYHNFNAGFFFKQGSQAGWISVVRKSTESVFSADEKQLMGSLLPHMNTAMSLNERLLNAQQSSQLCIDSLDRLQRACAFLSSSGKIILKNQQFDQLLSDNSIRVKDEKIVLPDASANLQLQKMISAYGAAYSIDSSQDLMPFETKENHRFVLHCLPYRPNENQLNFVGEEIKSVVFIQEVTTALNAPKSIDRLWNLTPTEHSILNSFIEGQSTTDVVHAENLSKNAIKFHMKNIFRKTDTHSQTALINLAARVKDLSANASS